MKTHFFLIFVPKRQKYLFSICKLETQIPKKYFTIYQMTHNQNMETMLEQGLLRPAKQQFSTEGGFAGLDQPLISGYESKFRFLLVYTSLLILLHVNQTPVAFQSLDTIFDGSILLSQQTDLPKTAASSSKSHQTCELIRNGTLSRHYCTQFVISRQKKMLCTICVLGKAYSKKNSKSLASMPEIDAGQAFSVQPKYFTKCELFSQKVQQRVI